MYLTVVSYGENQKSRNIPKFLISILVGRKQEGVGGRRVLWVGSGDKEENYSLIAPSPTQMNCKSIQQT